MNSFQDKKDKLLDPVIQMIPKNISPNHLTYLRLILVVPLVLLLLQGYLLLSLLVFVFGMILDSIDGPLARKRNIVTKVGMLIDPLADKALVGAVFILLGFTLIQINLFPLNLFATIIILELTTLIGSAIYLSFMYLKIHRKIKITANVFGKYKMLLYAIGSSCLILGLYVPGLLLLSIVCFWIGSLAALASGIQFLLSLRNVKY